MVDYTGVTYTGNNAMGQPDAVTPIDRVLTMIQPRSAFSRKLAKDTRDELGVSEWETGLMEVVNNTGAPAERRVRALELLQVFGPSPDISTLGSLQNDPSWEVRATAAYYLGMTSTDEARSKLAEMLGDTEPFVQRRAAEALLRTGIHPAMKSPVSAKKDVFPLLASSDRFVRFAGRNLLEQINTNQWKESALVLEEYPQATEALMAYLQSIDSPDMWDITRFVRREVELLEKNPSNEELMDLLRVIQRTTLEANGVTDFRIDPSAPGIMQDKRDPDAPRQRGGGFQQQPLAYEQMGSLLLERYPVQDKNLNRELARTLVLLQTPGSAEKIAAELVDEENDREHQIFFADVLSFLESGWDEASIEIMTGWIETVYKEQWKGGASFSGAIGYIAEDFMSHLSDEQRPAIAERIEAAKPQVAAVQGPGGFRPPTNISEEELEESLIYNPNILQADVEGGAWAYQKALCSTCHTFGKIGTEFGPDLTTVNQRFSRSDLVRSVTRPSEVVSDLWQVTQIQKKNGELISGTIYSEDAQNVRIQIVGGGLITIPVSEVESRSTMGNFFDAGRPAGYAEQPGTKRFIYAA